MISAAGNRLKRQREVYALPRVCAVFVDVICYFQRCAWFCQFNQIAPFSTRFAQGLFSIPSLVMYGCNLGRGEPGLGLGTRQASVRGCQQRWSLSQCGSPGTLGHHTPLWAVAQRARRAWRHRLRLLGCLACWELFLALSRKCLLRL